MLVTPIPSSFPATILASGFLGMLALLPGCQPPDGIRSYSVPKTTETTVRSAPEAAGEYRILGAAFPADQPNWFFKMAGPADQVGAVAVEFEQLLKTVRLPAGADATPVFTLPAGWVRGGPRGGMVPVAETIRPPGGKLEVTVIQARGGVRENVGRWVDQVGGKSGPESMDQFTRQFQAVDVKGLLVDVAGPKNPAGGMRGMGGMPGGR